MTTLTDDVINEYKRDVPQSFPDHIDHNQRISYQWRCNRAWKRIRLRLKEDRLFKGKVYYSLCIYFAFFVIGWIKGQFGPSFPDLRLICNVDIEKGSWIVTTFYIGYTFGSILEGFLYSKVNRKLLFGACLSILAAMVTVIPWCFPFEAMVAAHFVQGTMEGVLDPGGNAEILRIWGTKGGRTAILGMNFALSIGSVISPLATAPFLAETSENQTSANNTIHTSTFINLTLHQEIQPVQFPYLINQTILDNVSIYFSGDGNSSFETNKGESRSETRVYIAFSITAVLSFLTALSFVTLNTFFNEATSMNREEVTFEKSSKQLTRPLPQRIKIISLSIIGASLFMFNAIDEAFIAYLSTFVVTWTNEYLTPVTGKISSAFFISAMVGSSLNPLLLGYLMENVATIWFSYLFAIESFALVFLYISGVIITKYIIREYGSVVRIEEEENNTFSTRL
ncbi:sodium-dependent glucose transporter 1-like [Ylistrum balloti]|uniref:sodium-dependent glucose transporter 1-like n=1 Tax=Ylistrum balloti TaxID=509963 RepID=UPI0029058625|nr:sodium-dependent glucose transporter 1-like [Ylistrum balloti]